MVERIRMTIASIKARLSRKDIQNEAILDDTVQTKKTLGLDDENEERGNWSGRFDVFLGCLGYAVGLGNVWRFPYLCYKNGGGVFFIPYIIMLVFAGMPIVFLELSLGQFTSSGPVSCWKFSPIFQGIGIGMVAVTALQAIYYNVIVGWSFYYLFASFTSELPWQSCKPEWSSRMCIDNMPLFEDPTDCFRSRGAFPKDNGACYNINKTIFALYDLKRAKRYGLERELPSVQYFDRYVTRSYYSEGLQDLGPMQWKIVLCYLLAFFIVALALSKSIKSLGKAMYLNAVFPYLVLMVLFIRGLMLDGHGEGIEFYTKPDLSRLTDSVIWKDAAVQVFFSLSASWGGLIALSSNNRFHNNAMRDAIIISISNCLVSVLTGFVIFSFLGNLAHVLGVDVDEVADGGPSLAFVVYPYAVTKLPCPPFWSIVFFVMLITLGLNNEFALVETVITALMDFFPKLKQRRLLLAAAVCSTFFLLGLTMTTEGGIYMLEVIDTYAGSWNIMCFAICECVSICYFYGIKRFLQDIEVMIGKQVCGCFPFFLVKYWWAFNWCLATPGLVTFITVFSWVKYTGVEGKKFPDWADVLGWLMSLIAVVAIIGGGVYALCRTENPTQPLKEWGPALGKHRVLIAEYVQGHEVVSSNKVENSTHTVTQNDSNIQTSDEKHRHAYRHDSRHTTVLVNADYNQDTTLFESHI